MPRKLALETRELNTAAALKLADLFKKKACLSPDNAARRFILSQRATLTPEELRSAGWDEAQLQEAGWIMGHAHKWAPSGPIRGLIFNRRPNFQNVFIEVKRVQKNIEQTYPYARNGKLQWGKRLVPLLGPIGYQMPKPARFEEFLGALRRWRDAVNRWRTAELSPPIGKIQALKRRFSNKEFRNPPAWYRKELRSMLGPKGATTKWHRRCARLRSACGREKARFEKTYGDLARALWAPVSWDGGWAQEAPYFNPIYFPRGKERYFFELVKIVNDLYMIEKGESRQRHSELSHSQKQMAGSLIRAELNDFAVAKRLWPTVDWDDIATRQQHEYLIARVKRFRLGALDIRRRP